MTRSQSVLLAVLLVLTALVFGRMPGAALTPLLAAVHEGLAGTLAAVAATPAGVWWTVAGSLWWLPWGGRGCGRSACTGRSTSAP